MPWRERAVEGSQDAEIEDLLPPRLEIVQVPGTRLHRPGVVVGLGTDPRFREASLHVPAGGESLDD